jgi:hypothetical protein
MKYKPKRKNETALKKFLVEKEKPKKKVKK